jgi:hypothetical protein
MADLIVHNLENQQSDSYEPRKIGSPDTNNLTANNRYQKATCPMLTSMNHESQYIAPGYYYIPQRIRGFSDDSLAEPIQEISTSQLHHQSEEEVTSSVRVFSLCNLIAQILLILFVLYSIISRNDIRSIHNDFQPQTDDERQIVNGEYYGNIFINIGYGVIYLTGMGYTGFLAIGKNPMNHTKIIRPMSFLVVCSYMILSIGIGMSHFHWIWHNDLTLPQVEYITPGIPPPHLI